MQTAPHTRPSHRPTDKALPAPDRSPPQTFVSNTPTEWSAFAADKFPAAARPSAEPAPDPSAHTRRRTIRFPSHAPSPALPVPVVLWPRPPAPSNLWSCRQLLVPDSHCRLSSRPASDHPVFDRQASEFLDLDSAAADSEETTGELVLPGNSSSVRLAPAESSARPAPKPRNKWRDNPAKGHRPRPTRDLRSTKLSLFRAFSAVVSRNSTVTL